MQENNYLASRYPGWRKIESRKSKEDKTIEILLEQDPEYLKWETEVNDGDTIVKAGRTIQQNDPELDQRTLQKDMPEVFDEIMKPVVHYEVDARAFETLIATKPELRSAIERHLAYPDPIVKLAPIREVKEEDG